VWLLPLLLFGAGPPSVARADPPVTTVWFGSPQEGPVEGVVPRPEPPPPPLAPSPEPSELAARSPATPEPAAPSPEPSDPAPAASIPTPAPLAVVEEVPPIPVADCPGSIIIVRRRARGLEQMTMPLLDCEGRPREDARLALSILARPRAVDERPTEATMQAWRDADGDPELLAEGVRWLHPGLLERLQRVGEAFAPQPIEIVSGYRPDAPLQSRHHHGRALDLFVQDVPREAVRDLAVTFPQTGVGWYPNSTFVHVDVREQSAYWVDLSRPGERPRYVADAVPPPPEARPVGRPDAGPTTPARAPAQVDREALDRIRRETAEALRGIEVPAL
jgi:hypothetical protein